MGLLSLIKKLGGGPDPQWFGCGAAAHANNTWGCTVNTEDGCPFDGTITKFRTNWGTVNGAHSFKFVVFRKCNGTYQKIWASEALTPLTGSQEWAGYNVAVLEGDLLGIWDPNGGDEYQTTNCSPEGIKRYQDGSCPTECTTFPTTDTGTSINVEAWVES